MGFFGDLADSRVQQILNRSVGYEIPVEFTFSGRLNSPTLTINDFFLDINPYYAAVTETGLWFIHKSEVVFALPWEKILNIVMLQSDDIYSNSYSLEIHFFASQVAIRGMYKLEFPYCFWHKIRVKINKVEDINNLLNKFKEIKQKEGIFTEGFSIYQDWLDYGVVNEPITKEKYLELNKAWSDEETRIKSWIAWGNLNDAIRIFFYVGRNAALGKIPTSLIDIANQEWDKYDLENQEFTGNSTIASDKIIELTKITKDSVANIQSKFVDEIWNIELVDTRVDEWQSAMVMPRRLACIKTDKAGQVRIYNDFNS